MTRPTEKDKRYMCLSASGSYVLLGAGVTGALGDRADLYGRRDGKVFALQYCSDGELTVAGHRRGNGMGRAINSRVLWNCLQPFRSGRKANVPVVYDAVFDVLLMGDIDVDTEFSPEDFIQIQTRKIHQLTIQVSGEALRLKRAVGIRSDVLQKDDVLAFIEYNNGPVVLEKDGDMHIIRKPEVVVYAKEYWYGKRVYYRKMGDRATAVSPSIIALAKLEDLDGFSRLVQKVPMTLEVGHYFHMQLSQPALDALGTRLSAYTSGACLALTADPSGDIHAQAEHGIGYINAQSLYHQVSTRFPGAERLFLIPYWDMLVLSPEPQPDTHDWPPPDYFCRMLMTRLQPPRLMRYGSYCTTHKAESC